MNAAAGGLAAMVQDGAERPASFREVLAVGEFLICVVSLQPLYSAARNATLPNVLTGERYVVGMSIVSITDSLVQVAGFTRPTRCSWPTGRSVATNGSHSHTCRPAPNAISVRPSGSGTAVIEGPTT